MHGDRDLVFYDGDCGLCHAAVRFLVARDPEGNRFLFAPLHGRVFRETFEPAMAASLPDSMVVRTTDGAALLSSDAACYLLRRLGGSWEQVGRLLSRVPRGVRDAGYAATAARRRWLVRRPGHACPTVPEELRPRFLD